MSKHEGRLGLSIVVAGGRAADEHGGATVPTEGVLQDAGHFAVTVRHVSFLQEREGGRGGWMRCGGGKDVERRSREKEDKERREKKRKGGSNKEEEVKKGKQKRDREKRPRLRDNLELKHLISLFWILTNPKTAVKSVRLIMPHPTNLIIGRERSPNLLSWQKGKKGAGTGLNAFHWRD